MGNLGAIHYRGRPLNEPYALEWRTIANARRAFAKETAQVADQKNFSLARVKSWIGRWVGRTLVLKTEQEY